MSCEVDASKQVILDFLFTPGSLLSQNLSPTSGISGIFGKFDILEKLQVS